jgi:hypothetical protein
MNWNQIVKCLTRAATQAIGHAPDGFASRTMARIQAERNAALAADVDATQGASGESPTLPRSEGSSDLTIARHP